MLVSWLKTKFTAPLPSLTSAEALGRENDRVTPGPLDGADIARA